MFARQLGKDRVFIDIAFFLEFSGFPVKFSEVAHLLIKENLNDGRVRE